MGKLLTAVRARFPFSPFLCLVKILYALQKAVRCGRERHILAPGEGIALHRRRLPDREEGDSPSAQTVRRPGGAEGKACALADKAV